jgi:hypothetical protein
LTVGAVIVTVGGVVSGVPMPVTIRAMVPPPAVKFRLTLAVAATVGLKRTVTAWVVPTPTRLKAPPETMLKGAETDAFPETVPPPVFETVKV